MFVGFDAGPVDTVQYLRFSVISFSRVRTLVEQFEGTVDQLLKVFERQVSLSRMRMPQSPLALVAVFFT